MSYSIVLTEGFKKEFKQLEKKYNSLKSDVADLGQLLKEDSTTGISLGNNCYKIRMGIRSKGRGKSGGARVITYVKIIKETIYLLSIYDKSDQDSIDDKDILERIKSIEPKKKK